LNRASLSAFVLPLVTMLTAAIGMQDAGDGVAIAAALVGLLLGVAAARVLARRWRNALVPVVLGRATSAAVSSCGPTQTAALRSIAIPVIQQRSQ
jgi:positive regulator of sigma E activity